METKNNTNANKSRKAIRIVISILVAIALWVYVDRGLSVEVTMKVNNVPVEFSGEDTTLADKNLMLLSGYDTTIDLVLKGPRSELFKLDKSKVRIVADTSSIQETGQQTLTYQVYYQDDIQRSKISVDHASAYSVTVTVGEMDSKTVPIHCDIVGSTATGFTAGELTLDPAELNLRGQRDDLLNIAYAKVTLDISGADRTVVKALEWELYDYNDIKIDNPAVRSKVKAVQATLPVKTSKTVGLVINFVPAAGSTMDTVQYTVSPDKVTLVGEKDVLDTINAIVLDTLYLQDLQPSQSLTYSVTAPEGTTLAENVGPVTVTIVVTGVTERSVSVTAFNCENVPAEDVLVAVRPEEFVLAADGQQGIDATVVSSVFLGLNTTYFVELYDGTNAEIVEESSISSIIPNGTKVKLTLKQDKINVFTADGKTNLTKGVVNDVR